MTMVAHNATRSIRTHFFRVLTPIVVTVSVLISGLFAWREYETNYASRIESQDFIFKSFLSVVKQPLIQGSFIEARIRAEELLKHSQINCVRIQAQSESLENCKSPKTSSANIHRLESNILFSEDSAHPIAHVVVEFDNDDLISAFYMTLIKVAGGFVLLSVILVLVLSWGFSQIQLELKELMKIVESPGGENQVPISFRISEFHSLGTRLKNQLELSRVEIEARSAMAIARQVGHDIRSPVSSLKLAIKAANGHVDRKILAVIQNAAERIAEIASDVLERNSASEVGAEMLRAVSASDALNELVTEKALICSKKENVKISVGTQSEEFRILAHSADFKRAISNLIDNAIDAINSSGKITITSKSFGNQGEIQIIDDGIGMDEGTLTAIMSQGGSFQKPGGKGMGFQWAKKTIEKFGGALKVESSKGIGTTIRISLPILSESLSVAKVINVSADTVGA